MHHLVFLGKKPKSSNFVPVREGKPLVLYSRVGLFAPTTMLRQLTESMSQKTAEDF